MASYYISDSYGDYCNENLQNNAIHKYKEPTVSIADCNEESTSSFDTVVLQDVLEEKLDIISDLNCDEIESLVENHPSITILQGFNNYRPRIDYIDFSSSNLSWTKEGDSYGNDNTSRQTYLENSCITETLSLQTETTSSRTESSTDCEMVDYSNDSTNTSHQSEKWKSTKSAVLTFEGIFKKSNDDIVDTTSLTSKDKTKKYNEKTHTSKSKTSKKSNLSNKSKTILKHRLKSDSTCQNALYRTTKTIVNKGSKNEIELSNHFMDTKFTEVKNHNTAIGSFIDLFCSECDTAIPTKKRSSIKCQDCGSQSIFKCSICNEFLNPVHAKVYSHILRGCKPPSTFYCVECNYKTNRRFYRMNHYMTHQKH